MLNKYKVSVVFLLIFILCAGKFFAQEKQENIDSSLQDNFVIMEPVREHELNPQITTYAGDSQLLCGLFEGLFTYNPRTLEPQYAIAVDYKISRDKKRWTFIINEKACFSNGEKITADSVRDSWLQLLSTPQAPYASLLDVIKNAEKFRNGDCEEEEVGIYALSEDKLSIALEKPANYLPKVLCHTAFSVIHRNPTVYSGAFYLYDYSEGTYVLKKNPYYWDAQNTNLDTITIVQSDDDDENAFCYNTGLVDWVTANVSTDKVLNKESVQFSAEFATSYLFFKHSSRKPSYVKADMVSVWDYVEFRNALFEAMPWDSLRANCYVPATTFVYPLQGYPEIEGYSYTDLNEAKILMKAAREKYNVPEDKIIPLVMDLSENSFTADKLEALKEAFAELGVALQVRTFPAYYYLSTVASSDADLFCYVWIGDFADPLAFLELFRGSSSLNDSGWQNSEFDFLLDKASVVTNEERIKLLARAEEILLDSYEVIPVQHPVSFNVINLNEVGGWYSNAFDVHPLKYLYKKSVKSDLPNIVIGVPKKE